MEIRIREDVNSFVVERFCKGLEGRSSRFGGCPSIPDYWEFIAKYKTLEAAKKKKQLTLHPIYH